MGLSRRSGFARVLPATAVLAVAAMLAACGSDGDSGSDGAESQAEAYYEGKDIQMIVPFEAGGGGDTLARAVAKLMSDHIEGSPKVQVVNVTGGGSVHGANQFAKSDKRDGTVVLFTSASTLLPWMLGEDGVEYDLQDMTALLGFPRTRLIYAAKDSGLKTAKDLVNPSEELRIGGQTGLGTDLFTLLAFEALGVRKNVKMIFGYEGSSAQDVAFQQGEINMHHTSADTIEQDVGPQLASGEVVPLLAFGVPDGKGGLDPDPVFPDLPTVADAYEEINGGPPSGDAWDSFYATMSIVTPYFSGFSTHSDAPEAAVTALREGMEKVAADPELAKVPGVGIDGKLPYEPLIGQELLDYQASLGDIDREKLDWAREFLRTEYNV